MGETFVFHYLNPFISKMEKNNRVVKRINEIMFSKKNKNNLTPIDNEKINSKKVHYACYFRVLQLCMKYTSKIKSYTKLCVY